jgi:hypothetical protein
MHPRLKCVFLTLYGYRGMQKKALSRKETTQILKLVEEQMYICDTNHCKWPYVKKMRSKQLQPLGCSSSEHLYIPHHYMKHLFQTNTSFFGDHTESKMHCTPIYLLGLSIFPMSVSINTQLWARKIHKYATSKFLSTE